MRLVAGLLLGPAGESLAALKAEGREKAVMKERGWTRPQYSQCIDPFALTSTMQRPEDGRC